MQSPRWVYPDTVQSALTELNLPGSMPVAGGTTIVDLLKLGHPIPERLIDLSRLPLKAIEDRDDSIMLGGGVSNTDAAYNAVVRRSFPAVSEAILSGATQQIRNAATIAGNLLQATRCLISGILAGPAIVVSRAVAVRPSKPRSRDTQSSEYPRNASRCIRPTSPSHWLRSTQSSSAKHPKEL